MFSFTISPLSRERFEVARATLKEKGVVVEGDTGQVSARGIDLKFEYAETGEGELTLSVEHKPFFVGDGTIESTVRKWFA